MEAFWPFIRLSKSRLDVMEALYIRSLAWPVCTEDLHHHPFNCVVPLSTLFHPFTTLFINLNSKVTFLCAIICFFFVSNTASVCFYIIVLVLCCQITFWYIPWKEGPENVWNKTGYEPKSNIALVAVCAISLHQGNRESQNLPLPKTEVLLKSWFGQGFHSHHFSHPPSKLHRRH